MEVENNDSDDPKRKQIKFGGGCKKKIIDIDFVSKLPDSLILHILSFLDAKDNVITSALSKRWHDLWTYCPTLHFKLFKAYSSDEDYYYSGFDSMRQFISFVNYFLLCHRSPKIDKMNIITVYTKSCANDINAWIFFATRKSIRHLQLYFEDYNDFDYCCLVKDEPYQYDDGIYVLPPYLLYSPSLVTLKINNGSFEGHGLLSWKSLKDLSLRAMAVSNDLIRDILSGSPVLESIKFNECNGFDYLDIKSKFLTKLVIIDHKVHKSNADGLKISGPYLRSLQISGYLKKQCVSLLNKPASLVDASITFSLKDIAEDMERSREMYTKCMRDLVEKLRHVKNLTMNKWCLQVLSMVLVENAQPCPFSNLVYLRLHISLQQPQLTGLTRLLALTPLLDTLVLCMTAGYIYKMKMIQQWSVKSIDMNEESFWESQQTWLAVTLLNLKTVTIAYFEGSEKEMELIAFMLKNTRRLEKMIIQSRKVFSPLLKKYVPRLEESLLLILTQRLLSFPKCCSDAVILFS